jgi:uncharacterized integral membrane protein (TIGR00698 family)
MSALVRNTNIDPQPPLARRGFGIWPGLILTSAVAVTAFVLRQLPGVSVLSPMILAIVIGIGFQNLVGIPDAARAGVAFAMRQILRFAIILLGLQLTVAQVAAVGASGIAVIVISLVATFTFTKWLGRIFGVDRKLAELIAAGTSICGASAVVAVNTVTDAPDEDVAYAVACVTVFGSIAMFVYPLLPALLALAPHSYGLWAGVSIHEVAQVVAAGFQDGRDAGEFATIAKLSRVMMLAPMVIAVGLTAPQQMGHHGHTADMTKSPVPWFVFGFVALVGLNSVVAIPPEAKSAAATATTFLLAVALAAMGLETNISKLRAKGMRPLALGLAASLFIAGLSLFLIKISV